MTFSRPRNLAAAAASKPSTAVLCRVGLLAAAIAVNAHAAPPGWNLTFSDDFAGAALDETRWEPILWTTPYNNERQAYRPSRVAVEDGNLVLTADAADFGGKSYTSGKVESKFAQQYGRWEIRAKLPGTQGTWPAIWLLPATETYNWPTAGEIDIMENRGNQPTLTSSAFHWGRNVAGHRFVVDEYQNARRGRLDDFHDEFHTYAVEWDAAKLRFFVDDVNYHTVYNSRTGGFLASQSAPMELNINVAVGGDFLGAAQPNDASVWPQQMLVDSVRVYRRDADPPPVVFRNGGFEGQGGSLAGWSTFGNVRPNVTTHNEAVRHGDDALKLFGQFAGKASTSGLEQGITVAPGDRVAATAHSLVRASDALEGGNQALMKLDFYSEFGAARGSSSLLDRNETLIAAASSDNDVWTEHELTAVAPTDAVEVRLAFVFNQPGDDAGAVHIDDVSFENVDLVMSADADD